MLNETTVIPSPPTCPPPSIRKNNTRIINHIHYDYSYPAERPHILEVGNVGEFVTYSPDNQLGRLLEIIAYDDKGNKYLKTLLDYYDILFDDGCIL
jgi:hypothetical protein